MEIWKKMWVGVFFWTQCIIHDTTASMHQQVPCTRKKMILGSRLIACCKLAPALSRQMWRHNDVIRRNEYLISTLSEAPFLRYSLCNFCLNPHVIHGYMKENVIVFFLNTVYHLQSSLRHRWPCSWRIWRLTFFGSPILTDVNAF